MRRHYYICLFILAAFSILPLVSGRQAGQALAESKVGRPPLFFNITSGEKDVHAVSMALELATAARKEGREVIAFLNVGAPYFASKNLSEDVKFADFPPVKTLLRELIASGAKVFVCAHCTHALGLTTESLASGVTAAKPGEILAQMKPETIALSY